jgi:hypothetical protein
VSDLLLRQVSAGRAGAEGADDYDVIGADGLVIGRIFKATTAPAGTPWLWTLAYGQHEDRTPTHGHEPTRATARIAQPCPLSGKPDIGRTSPNDRV